MSSRYYLVHRFAGKGEPREDHKYISREWKNGKWVYTYKDDSKGASKLSNTKTLTPKGSTKQVFNKDDTASNTKLSTNKSTYFNKESLAKTIDSGRKILEKTSLPDQTTIKVPNTKNSTKEASSENEAKKQPYLTLYDAGKANAAKKKEAEKAAKAAEIAAKVEKAKSSIKKFFTDPFGSTKRKEYKDAEKKLVDAKSDSESAKSNYDYVHDKGQYDRQLINAGKGYVKARKEYFDTPVGKIEEFGLKIKSFFEDLFDKEDEPEAKKEESEDKKETHKDIIDRLKKEAEDKKKEAEDKKKEAEDEKKEAYDKAQTEERDGIRTQELDALLEQYGEPETIFQKLLGIDNNPLPELNLKHSATTLDEDMALVNPNYNPDTYGKDESDLYDQNCAVCSLVYDLRRRGYDVTAASETVTALDDGKTGLNIFDILDCYEGADINNVVTMNDALKANGKSTDNVSMSDVLSCMEKAMLSEGEGARGQLSLCWTVGGGHSVSWEVENGKVVIRDSQTNKKYKLSDYKTQIKNLYYLRTDNLTPSEKIMQYAKNRQEGDDK